MTKASKEGQRKAPILRFKGFTDAWEQRQLKEVADIVGGGTPSTDFSEYWNGNINWFTPNEINSQIYFSESKRKISNLGLKKSSAKLLPANRSILFTSRATIGEMGILTQDATTNQGFQSLVLHNEVIPYFIFSMKSALKRQAIKKASGSTFLEISKREVEKLKIIIPSEKEQKKVSMLFKSIDNLITLYERKVKLLLQIKKYLLNNLFSEKEYPDLRFKYSKKDNWKKISLSSVLTYKNGKAHEKEINNKGNLDLVMMNSITTEGRLITKKKIFSPQDTLSKNDIVIVLSDIAKGELIGKSSVIPCDDQYVLNQRIGCLRPTSNIDSFFVSKYINQKSQYFKSHAAGTSQINLSKSDVLNCTIYIPNIDEQHYVSNFIINIEKNINFYKDKKQCFIEIKNTLLNNMFI